MQSTSDFVLHTGQQVGMYYRAQAREDILRLVLFSFFPRLASFSFPPRCLQVFKMLMGTPSEDPDAVSVNASDVQIIPGRTQEMLVTGNGFSAEDPPELRFEHALDRGVKTHVRRMLLNAGTI